METRKAFSKADILIALLCIVFVALNLGAIGRAGRSRAKEAVCRANLKQWGYVFSAYAADYDGYNPHGGWAHSWWSQVLPYAEPDVIDRNLFFCPMATRILDPQPFKAWNYGQVPMKWGGGRWTGSYGVNPWVFSFNGNSGSMFNGFDPEAWRWKRAEAACADNVPFFGDCTGPGSAPKDTNIPAEFRDLSSPPSYIRGMGQWCIDRHNCAINLLFMDFSVRRTNLKCLWKLKWHRQFDTENSGPVEGEPYPDGWPDWMADCPGCD